jgi:type I restriction enzyme S subunit
MMQNKYKYKDSGIEWLGEVPVGWELLKLKYCSDVIMGQSPSSDDYSDDDSGMLPFLQGNADFTARYPIPRVYCDSANKIIPKGSILVSVRAPVGALNEADQDYGIGRGLCALVLKSILMKEYAWYQLHVTRMELNSLATGSTYDAVSVDEVTDMTVLVPQFAEQQAIAAYLDRETARIDALIQKKEQMIGLLKEKRLALITQAVTKGLNPNVPMKESGIEWLGEVPEHWEVKKLKYLGKSLIGLTYSPEEIVFEDGTLVLRASNIQNSTLSLGRDDDVSVVTKIPNELMVVEDDILICSRNGSKALIGKAAIIGSDVNATFGAFMTVFRSRFIRFIIWVLHSSMFCSLCSGYVSSTINQLTQDDLNNIAIPLPPDNELKEITKHLEKESYFIDKLIIKADRSISLLREYRASLIYHAVTGKIDLRDYDAQVQ